MGIATVITSGKGGAGKSTTTVGLGRALASRGRRVLLVDCDAGLRSLDRLTGTEEELIYDISDVVFGRCSPAQAIYPCPDAQGMFLMPAPAQVEDMIRPAVMRKLTPLLKQYYDHVLLDSPAGVGMGFQSAACAADRAIVLCGPDPVSVRGAVSVRRLLEELGIEDRRLLIGPFDEEFFLRAELYPDLDSVIDAAGIRLLGLIPKDQTLAAAFPGGKTVPADTPAMLALGRVAERLEGRTVPIPDRLL